MICLLNIPEQYQCNYSIPEEKMFGTVGQYLYYGIKEITWIAAIKPLELAVSAEGWQNIYSEIQVLHVPISAPEGLYDIARGIYKAVKYPTIILLEYAGKFIVSTCRVLPSQKNFDENVVKGIRMSHWIYPDLLSISAKKFLSRVNEAFSDVSDLQQTHRLILSALDNFYLQGTSRAHAHRLIVDMIGKCSGKGKEEILQFCTPYRYYPTTGYGKGARYDKTQRSSQYTLVHDYEDLWYCFMKHPKIRSTIEGRQYETMEELLYRIDSKEW